MNTVVTDFGIVAVKDEASYEDLKQGGPMHQELLNMLDSIWQYQPNIEYAEVKMGRIGLWGNGDVHKWIILKFSGEVQKAVVRVEA